MFTFMCLVFATDYDELGEAESGAHENVYLAVTVPLRHEPTLSHSLLIISTFSCYVYVIG